MVFSNFENMYRKKKYKSCTIAFWSYPMVFTSKRTVASDIVTHIISSTMTARGDTVNAVVIRGTYCKSRHHWFKTIIIAFDMTYATCMIIYYLLYQCQNRWRDNDEVYQMRLKAQTATTICIIVNIITNIVLFAISFTHDINHVRGNFSYINTGTDKNNGRILTNEPFFRVWTRNNW